MAYCNIKTGEIYGAEKGTLTYYHEEAHRDYEQNKRRRLIRSIQEVSFDLLVMAIAFFIILPTSFFKSLIFITLLVKIISNLTEEIDCWIIAKIKMGVINEGVKGIEI